MIYSSMNSSILREARMVNMILRIDIILHEHSTVVQLNRLSLCRLSPFLLFPPASLYCCSERCTCASLFSNRPAQEEDVKLKTCLLHTKDLEGTIRFYFYILTKAMNKNEFICQLFKDMSVVILTRSREGKRFRIKRD